MLRRVHDDGVALGMAHSLEARDLDERVAEIDYREFSQPERALQKRHGFEYGRFRELSFLLTSVYLAREKSWYPKPKPKKPSKKTKTPLKTLMLHFPNVDGKTCRHRPGTTCW